MFSLMSVRQSVILSGGDPHHTRPSPAPSLPSLQSPGSLLYKAPALFPRHVQTCSGWTSLYRDPPPYPLCRVLDPFCTRLRPFPPDMFKLVQVGPHFTGTPPPEYIFTLIHYVDRTVGMAGGWHSTEMPSGLHCTTSE